MIGRRRPPEPPTCFGMIRQLPGNAVVEAGCDSTGYDDPGCSFREQCWKISTAKMNSAVVEAWLTTPEHGDPGLAEYDQWI